jgi:hypothetical protein
MGVFRPEPLGAFGDSAFAQQKDLSTQAQGLDDGGPFFECDVARFSHE